MGRTTRYTDYDLDGITFRIPASWPVDVQPGSVMTWPPGGRLRAQAQLLRRLLGLIGCAQ